ncbi:MAG: Serine aminopeptidase [Firmicutes bacterium]|nr:Serine aminopeptidase [Bacillota bacterium]
MREEITIDGEFGELPAVIDWPGRRNLECCLVICHGFRGSKEGGGRAQLLAERAALLGYTVVRFDFTPLCCLTRQIAEIRQVINFCREKVTSKVVLLGRSMGGSASLVYAATFGTISALCLWATPSDLDETFRLSLGERYHRLIEYHDISIKDEYGELILNVDFIRDFANYDLKQGITKLDSIPLLVIHGSEDEIVPLSQAEKLFSLATCPKEFVILPGGNHQLSNCYFAAADIVISWLSQLPFGCG